MNGSAIQADYLVAREPLHEDTELCSSCGAKCCKRGPGIAFPRDFGATHAEIERNVRTAMATGLWTVSYMYGDIGSTRQRGRSAFYVRPSAVGAYGLLDDSSHGRCGLLSKDGCRLPRDRRPTQCRALVPTNGESCNLVGSCTMKHAAVAWFAFNAFLKSIVEESVERDAVA